MSIQRVSEEEARALRDSVEDALADRVSSVLRGFLSDVKGATLSGLDVNPETLVAAAEPLPRGEVPTLGAIAQRWAAGVDAGVALAVERAYRRAWRLRSSTSPAEQAMLAYVATVRDRLVRGTYFGVTVYDEAFAAVRRSLAQASAEGWTRRQLAQRIAAELRWETDGPYWRTVKQDVDHRIDSLLDPIGPPGTPAREYARLNDPRVLALREQRNLAIRHLDAERSVWQTRATLIARTESTGLANHAAQAAFGVEGVEKKMWLSTADARTRLSHLPAPRGVGGQVVRVDQHFTVGGAAMMFPGDPNGPVEEVANCRCTMVSPDYL